MLLSSMTSHVPTTNLAVPGELGMAIPSDCQPPGAAGMDPRLLRRSKLEM